MARISSTPDALLLSVVQRIIDQVKGASESNTYISTVSTELPPNPSDHMFECSLAHNFQAEPSEFTGAGNAGLHTVFTVMVTIHSTLQLDEQGRDAQFLTNESLGVCKLMTRVVAALSMYDPVNADGDYLLAQPLRLESGQIPPKDDRKRGFVTLLFGAELDWDVSTAATD